MIRKRAFYQKQAAVGLTKQTPRTQRFYTKPKTHKKKSMEDYQFS